MATYAPPNNPPDFISYACPGGSLAMPFTHALKQDLTWWHGAQECARDFSESTCGRKMARYGRRAQTISSLDMLSRDHTGGIVSDFFFKCPKCRTEIKATDNLSGKSAPCPHCQASVKIPWAADVYESHSGDLEGKLDNFSTIFFILAALVLVGAIIAAVVKENWLILLVALQALPLFFTAYFVQWMIQMLSLQKKIAGVPGRKIIAGTRRLECDNCFTKVSTEQTECSHCKRVLRWPSN